jgi:hypothetical protein
MRLIDLIWLKTAAFKFRYEYHWVFVIPPFLALYRTVVGRRGVWICADVDDLIILHRRNCRRLSPRR